MHPFSSHETHDATFTALKQCKRCLTLTCTCAQSVVTSASMITRFAIPVVGFSVHDVPHGGMMIVDQNVVVHAANDPLLNF